MFATPIHPTEVLVRHPFGLSKKIVLLWAGSALYAGCYAPPTSSVTQPRYDPPPITLPPLGTVINLNALRTSWAMYPMGYNHTRTRNLSNGSQGQATITPYRGIHKIGPNKPPSGTVLFAHITNWGTASDAGYNLQPSTAADYYVIVDPDPANPSTSRWRILEVPVGATGIVSFVQRNGTDMSGHLVHCAGHVPKIHDEADFWNCKDGDGDHASAFSSATALASAGTMQLSREFWNNVFGSTKSTHRVNNGDESAWASCSGGCCTLEF